MKQAYRILLTLISGLGIFASGMLMTFYWYWILLPFTLFYVGLVISRDSKRE